MKKHQRDWLYGELKEMPQVKHQIEVLEDAVDKMTVDLGRFSSPSSDLTRERVQGGRKDPLAIQYLSKMEQIERLKTRISELKSKFDFMSSCLDSISDQGKFIISSEIQQAVPRWQTVEKMEDKFGGRYYSRRIQRIKSEALEQLLKLLLGILA